MKSPEISRVSEPYLIPLSRGMVAVVDEEDYERANQFEWYAAKRRHCFYACRSVKSSTGKWGKEFLHQFRLGVKGVDHRDGEGLNNQRGNIRAANTLQNNRGFRRKASGKTSQYRGVCWHAVNEKWVVHIMVNNHQYHVGCFYDEKLAARAYDKAAKETFGGFASLNFPDS